MIIGSVFGGSGQTSKSDSEPNQSTQQQQQASQTESSQSVSGGETAARTDNSGADSGGSAENQSDQQAAAAAPARTTEKSSSAEPRSVVNAVADRSGAVDVAATDRARKSAEQSVERARTEALIESISAVQGQPKLFETGETVDRYAPAEPAPAAEPVKSVANSGKLPNIGRG